MNMQQFINQFGLKETRQLAKAADTDLNYLKQIAWGLRKPGISLLEKLTLKSGRRLTIKGLRPDIYNMVVDEMTAEQGANHQSMESQHGTEQPAPSENRTLQHEHLTENGHAA